MEKLTKDKKKIVSAISKDIFHVGGSGWDNYDKDVSDSLTTAMLFTAVDKDLSWNSGFKDKQDNLVRKIMIPMVYRKVTTVLQTPGNRKPPKADGSDKCATALIPEIEQLNKVLWDHHFTVVMSILNNGVSGTVPDIIYGQLFASLLVPYYQAPIPKAGEYLKDPKNFDHKAYAKKIHNMISEEVMSCDWEDPIGYNTLGL